MITVTPTKATPELSQRLFGSSSTTISATAPGGSSTGPSETISLLEISDERESAPVHLPTILGLKIRAINTTTPAQQGSPQTPTKSKPKIRQATGSNNSNSLLKQQLRGGAKDPEVPPATRITGAVTPNAALNAEEQSKEMPKKNQDEVNACIGLHSLANAAEQQAAQVASTGNLHHQLLLHMAANNSMLNTTDYYQQQQQESPRVLASLWMTTWSCCLLMISRIKAMNPIMKWSRWLIRTLVCLVTRATRRKPHLRRKIRLLRRQQRHHHPRLEVERRELSVRFNGGEFDARPSRRWMIKRNT